MEYMNSYKIGIVGYGHWGKTITNVLVQSGYNNIVICDPAIKEIEGFGFPVYDDYKQLINCDKIFICTPATTHYEICKFFLNNHIPIFCEKPLAISQSEVIQLYNLAKINNTVLFVDWTFIYNDLVIKIKDYIYWKYKKPPSLIIMNRLNKGPIRDDVSALYDLSSHDISIITFLLNKPPLNVQHKQYNILGGSQNDTCISTLDYDNTQCIITSSWAANSKIRTCYFNCDDETLMWDDYQKILVMKNDTCYSISSPLANSIKTFLKCNTTPTKNQTITMMTMDILNAY